MAERVPDDNAMIVVEVVWADAEEQSLLEIEVAAGSRVGDAIERSGIYARHPGRGLETAEVGIWGRVVSRDARLEDGDRIEIYRPLQLDPREARRRLAQAGRTMSQGDSD